VIHHDVPITREMVQDWVDEWRDGDKSSSLDIFVRNKLEALNLPETVQREGDAGNVPIIDKILDDLDSYA
jgi:hypothetical protein